MQILSSLHKNTWLLTGVVLVILVAPALASAQAPNLTWVNNLTVQILQLIRAAVPVLTALALLLFIWGVIKYFILGSEDQGARETGRAYMLYALIGLVAIVAVWGLVALVLQLLGVGTDGATTPTNYFPEIL